jgi:hypothetical protein
VGEKYLKTTEEARNQKEGEFRREKKPEEKKNKKK